MIQYDFNRFNEIFANMKAGKIDKYIKKLKEELNRFFKDSECKETIYTKNHDKPFFGMYTYMIMNYDQTYEILHGDKPVRIDKYIIELDSKLFQIGLDSSEITAILLHEIGHVVNDTVPADTVRKSMDKYLAKNNTSLSILDSYRCPSLVKFALADAMRKSYSIFTRRDKETGADEFVYQCGYGPKLESAFKKIMMNPLTGISGVNNKFVALEWLLNIYTNIAIHRLGAIKTLNRIGDLSGSELEKREVNHSIEELRKLKIDTMEQNFLGESTITMNLLEADKSGGTLIGRIKRNGMKAIEEDLYEYQMRARNISDENEAIILMRQMNSRMSIIDDYITYGDCPDRERDRWIKVYDRYDNLRETLANKAHYNNKQYGLFVDMNYQNDMGYSPTQDPYLR